MSLTTLILDLMVVGLSLMLIGWVSDLVHSHHAPRQIDGPPAPHLADRDQALLARAGSWSRWSEN
jgi:hypothetical protein